MRSVRSHSVTDTTNNRRIRKSLACGSWFTNSSRVLPTSRTSRVVYQAVSNGNTIQGVIGRVISNRPRATADLKLRAWLLLNCTTRIPITLYVPINWEKLRNWEMKYLMHQPKTHLSKAVQYTNYSKIENKNLNLNVDNLLTWVILLDFHWLTWAR